MWPLKCQNTPLIGAETEMDNSKAEFSDPKISPADDKNALKTPFQAVWRYMGKVKKFGPSSTLILRRNRRPKIVRAQCAPPLTIRVNF